MNDELPKCISFNSKSITVLTKERLEVLSDAELEALSNWSISIRSERVMKESQQKQAQPYYSGGAGGFIKKAKSLAKRLRKEKKQ